MFTQILVVAVLLAGQIVSGGTPRHHKPSSPRYPKPLSEECDTTNASETRNQALEIVLANNHVHQLKLSAKDLIHLSQVNKNLNGYLRGDASWKYLKVLMKEPCFSGGFAKHSYYVPSSARSPNSAHSDSNDSITFVFTKWQFGEKKLKGQWFDGLWFHPYRPDLEPQEKIVECMDLVLAADLNLNIAAKKPPMSLYSSFYFSMKTWPHEFHVPDVEDAKQGLLWLAIKNNMSRVVEFLLSEQQRTEITQIHLEAIAETRNLEVLTTVLNGIHNGTLKASTRINYFQHILSYFEPPQHLMELILDIEPLEYDDIVAAAYFGRASAFRYLLSRSEEFDLNAEWFLLDLYSEALSKCHLSILDILLEDYDLNHLDPWSARGSFICGVRFNKNKALHYFQTFNLENDFRRWLTYLRQDENPHRHIRDFVKRSYDFESSITLPRMIDSLQSFSMKDLRTFHELDLLLNENNVELDPDSQRLVFLFAFKRGNVMKAKQLFREYRFHETQPHFQDWMYDLKVEQLPGFFFATRIKVRRSDVDQLVCHATQPIRGVDRMLEWLIKNLSYWTKKDYDFFESLVDENFGDSVRTRLMNLIGQRRERLRARSHRKSRRLLS